MAVGMEWAARPLVGCPCCADVGPLMRELATHCPNAAALDAPLFDTHSHVHLRPSKTHASLCRSAVLAVDESCWEAVLARCAADVRAFAGLGIHPWRVHDAADGWQARLAALLARHRAAIVGEIGLCKCAKNLRGAGMKARNWPLQVSACAQQLRLAAAATPARPASIHCVKAHATLLDVLRSARTSELPPAMALHSFSGSEVDVRAYLALPDGVGARLYFGFSHTVNVAMGGAPGTPVCVLSPLSSRIQRLCVSTNAHPLGRVRCRRRTTPFSPRYVPSRQTASCSNPTWTTPLSRHSR